MRSSLACLTVADNVHFPRAAHSQLQVQFLLFLASVAFLTHYLLQVVLLIMPF